ncbi:MAG: TIGR01244 family sulfur transferase [Pseudomonadota bacterium]|nr:TIGR01244 family sulfur transferase [Pseudomonadota bacterium]
MDFKQIDDGFAVTGQIETGDITAIAQAGFKSVVCNRPDEEVGAVAHGAIERAANAAGLQFRFIPVAGGFSSEQVESMAAALGELPRPILAYCRSGARSANLYSAASQEQG